MAASTGTPECYQGARVAVIGATGFIGRWVTESLARAGARVDLIVRDGARAEALRRELRVEGDVVPCDVRDSIHLQRAIAAVRPTVTFNLAGYGVDPTERDEQELFRVNVQAVRALCDAVATVQDMHWPGRALVHVGTQREYGPMRLPSETAVPTPTTAYGRSKLEGTRAVEEAGRTRGVRGVTARLFNVYGAGEHAGRLLPSLIAAARSGTTLALTSGRQRLDLVYVEDVALALLSLGAAPGRAGEVVNLATGRLTSVRRFVLEAARQLAVPPERLQFGALADRSEEARYHAVPTERLRELIGWAPPADVTRGIRMTLQRSQ